MKIVHAHYAIIRQFVCRVSLRIDPDDWNTFADELNKYIPGIGVLPVSIGFAAVKVKQSLGAREHFNLDGGCFINVFVASNDSSFNRSRWNGENFQRNWVVNQSSADVRSRPSDTTLVKIMQCATVFNIRLNHSVTRSFGIKSRNKQV